jgi:hypothetical protein
MWRSLYMAAIVYACGAPGWDGYRPAALDRPLQIFYQQVNVAVAQGSTLLVAANAARSVYARAYVARAGKQLHVSEQALTAIGAGDGSRH